MKFKCCICGDEFEGYGNNPWPLGSDENDKCCNDCNMDIVIPARVRYFVENCDGTEQS